MTLEESLIISSTSPVSRGWIFSLDINRAYWESRVRVAVEFTNNAYFPPGIPWAPDMEEEGLAV